MSKTHFIWNKCGALNINIYSAESKDITWEKRTSSHLLKTCFATSKKKHCTAPDPCREASRSFSIQTRQSQDLKTLFLTVIVSLLPVNNMNKLEYWFPISSTISQSRQMSVMRNVHSENWVFSKLKVCTKGNKGARECYHHVSQDRHAAQQWKGKLILLIYSLLHFLSSHLANLYSQDQALTLLVLFCSVTFIDHMDND